MRPAALLVLLIPALLGQAPAGGDVPVDKRASGQGVRSRRDFLRDLYLEDASSYTIYRDADRKEKVELRREPAYVWTNPTRNAGQDGHVFVWTCRGRAEVVGTIFSSPTIGPREVLHELHSLATTVLEVERASGQGWKPLQPGIDLKPIPGAPAPGTSPPRRLAQMRALIREFAATAVDINGRNWELRALPQPLYRYESTDPEVTDGAVFTLVSSAGTDPEAMIVLEARKDPGSPEATWRFAAARFTDMALTVKHRDKVVYSAPVIPFDAAVKDPTARYHLLKDRNIPPVEEPGTAPDATPAPSTAEPRPNP